MKEIRQCPSCGGIYKRSGCERANVDDFTPDEYLLQAAWLCIEELGSQLLHDGVPVDPEHPKRIAMDYATRIVSDIANRLEKT